MEKIKNYLNLIRFNKQTGSLLLFWPCAWSLALACAELKQAIDWHKLGLFLLGSFLMRSAGCIINDIFDREIDRHVERTKNRPIAANLITVKEAVFVLSIFLITSLWILLQFNNLTIFLGVFSLVPIVIYPFMKRFTNWAQFFLGLTFNFGALMGWSAITGDLSIHPLIIYFAAVCWTISYDTIYAFQDLEYDLKYGIKSTAVKISAHSQFHAKTWILVFLILFISFLLSLSFMLKLSWVYVAGLVLTFLVITHRMQKLNLKNPESCMEEFTFARVIGFCIFLSILAHFAVNDLLFF